MVTQNSCDYQPTQYNVQTGGASGTLNNVAPSATSGVPVISQGASSQPVFGTAVVAGGGTGVTTMTTAYAPVCAGTTATGPLQVASTGISNSGYVLTSTGSSSLPTWQASSGGSGITTINGDTGSITGATVTIKAGVSTQNCGSSVEFVNSGTTSTFNVTDGLGNTVIGQTSGNGSISGNNNTVVGTGSAVALGAGIANAVYGDNAGRDLAGAQYNTAIGSHSLNLLASGSYNVGLGYNAGNGYVGAESSNININGNGTAAESNVLRIGAGTGTGTQQLSKAFISGINGNTVSSAVYVTINSSTDQLGVTSAGPAIAWTDEAVSFNALASNGYFISATSTATLPASPAQGNTISFIVDTTQFLTIQANTGQIIRLGNVVSASAGTAVSSLQGDSITLVYRSSDTAWIASAAIGTWNVT